MSDLTDKELKTLMRGRAVNAGMFVWGQNTFTGTDTTSVHRMLRLTTTDPDLEDILKVAQDLLAAYGFKIDRQYSNPTAQIETNISFDADQYITAALGSVKSNTELIQMMLKRGTLEHFNRATTDAEKLAVVFSTLAQ